MKKISPKDAWAYLSACATIPTILVVALWNKLVMHETRLNIILYYIASIVGIFFVSLGSYCFFGVCYPKNPKKPRLAGLFTFIKIVLCAAFVGLMFR